MVTPVEARVSRLALVPHARLATGITKPVIDRRRTSFAHVCRQKEEEEDGV
jgi:hypothetical protein